MTKKKRAFIIMPMFFDIPSKNLKYQDVLTYITIKSFDNKYQGCFPAYETIAERSGMCRDFVIKSINRLEKAGYISIYKRKGYQPNTKKSYPNHYQFLDDGYTYCIPYDVFKTNDLTSCEIAMLLLFRQFCVSVDEISNSINEISNYLGLTEATINKQFYSLVKKGYIDKSQIKRKRLKLTKINWDFTAYLNKDEEVDAPLLMVA